MSMITYRLNQTPRAGPASFVTSQVHTWFGSVAVSSGLTRGGWVACRRRSVTSSCSRRIRYMVEIEQWYSPSSSSFAHAVAGASSRWVVLSSSRTRARSAGDSARGCTRSVCGVGAGRGGAGLTRWCRYQLDRATPVARHACARPISSANWSHAANCTAVYSSPPAEPPGPGCAGPAAELAPTAGAEVAGAAVAGAAVAGAPAVAVVAVAVVAGDPVA